MTTTEMNELIDEYAAKNFSEVIHAILKEHKDENEALKTSWDEYAGSTPIFERSLPIANGHKLNNQISHDYRGLIVSQCNGYLFGHPITYIHENEKVLEDFRLRNTLEDADNTTGTWMGATGRAVRLLYIDVEGKERVKTIPCYEVIFLQDASELETDYALRYYTVEVVSQGRSRNAIRVEWYDKTKITYFLEDEKGVFRLDDYFTDESEIEHLFNYVPLIKYKNNELEQSDYEKVKTIIDAYDRIISDTQNEIEEFRLAYMIFYGTEPSEEVLVQARQTGAFGADEKDRIEFLTKQINDVFVENVKSTHDENIFKFSQSVNMSDEKFSGASQSGESRKWKLVDLENKAIIKERKFTKASRDMFKVLASAWQKKGIQFDWTKLEMEFTRNLPKDLKYESEITNLLKGFVDEETRLKLLSFIDDPQEIMDKMESEMPEVNLDLVNESSDDIND